jgi:5-methylcytosine-specific restriction enzyme subunit McrC
LKKETFHICEYGVIRSADDYDNSAVNTLEELYLQSNHFNSIYRYISQNQDDSKDSEKPFVLFSKGKRKQIKVKNYVGVIETQEGLHLEILPKIHTGKTTVKEELDETKIIFLKMLKHLKNSPFVNISKAHIETQKDFPILEVFIKSYIQEAETVFNYGVKSDYVLKEENIPYIKGKIKINGNIKFNFADKSKFYCEYSEYSPDIPANRLVKSTLMKLMKLTNRYSSYYSINKVLSHLEEVSPSVNIKADLIKVQQPSRLLSKYKMLLLWSEIFLTNKSFTNFKGDNLNMAILFPMEKVFEDYIAHLFKRYSDGYRIKIQDKSYFLVDSHKGERKFSLRPDIVLDKVEQKKKIIDTKWKLLDENSLRSNYNISSADMYQLYAYGKRYTYNDATKESPNLVLLYPSNPNFTKKLDNFIYEGDLELEVIPFDLSGKDDYHKSQIESILNEKRK